MHAAYPTANDLSKLLSGTTFPSDAQVDYNAAIAYAVAQWESNVGWYPYLSTEVSEVRTFDPPGGGTGFGRSTSFQSARMLNLGGGLISVSSLSIGFVNTPGQTNVGSVLTQGLQFYLRPNNALARGLVATSIEFLTPVRGLPQSIRVAGVFGRVLTIPDDVWMSILFKGVSVLALRANLGLGAIESIKTESTTTQYVDFRKRILNADEVFNQQVQNVKRIVI